ncbi:uncharacterized protein LOC135018576 [Pseudophryne corroboree]|uniref:uncharacterized protein LOC135018576 n=1 Tax=Pseudophryne corroboree TaxID=495146 RepID=UPI003081C5F3
MVAGYSPLGTPKEWTSGRKGNLQIVVRLSLGILGIVLLVVPSSTWTPGLKIEKRELHTVRWGWNNATIPRTQDNFTCQANQRCTNIVNITIPGTMWAGPPDPQRNRYRPTFALHQSEGNITINAAVNISCCSKPYRFRFLPKEEKNKEYKNCSKQGATTFRLAVKDVLILVCHNATEIKNRTWWAQDLMFIDINASRIDIGHVKRLPSTCKNVGTQAQKTVLVTQVVFPPNNRQCISRQRRAWYDTLLGGYGTLTGVLNRIDIETLANRMHSTGSKLNDGLTLQAKWMPTIFEPAKISAGIDTLMNQLINASNDFAVGFDTNITKCINWTVCTLQTMYEQQQKGVMQTMLMTGNEQVWRTIFNTSVSRDAWIHLEAAKMICNDTICQGILTMYNVTKVIQMCKYIVMPLLLGPSGGEWYWFPTMKGEYIDENNRTHDLSICTPTLQGKICRVQSAVYEPCLLENGVNLCKWIVLPLSHTMMMEVAPQEVCLVTDTSAIPGMVVPFSGCISNVSSLTWENETFILYADREEHVTKYWSPQNLSIPQWDLKLDKLHTIMKQSKVIEDHIKYLNQSIVTHQVTTTIIADQ